MHLVSYYSVNIALLGNHTAEQQKEDVCLENFIYGLDIYIILKEEHDAILKLVHHLLVYYSMKKLWTGITRRQYYHWRCCLFLAAVAFLYTG
jgi:hypothetical protein